MAWNSKLHGTVGTYCSVAPTVPWRQLFRGAYSSVALTLPWRLLFRGAYSFMVLTIPRHLNFQQFDQIKVARDKILRTFIESVEIKVAR